LRIEQVLINLLGNAIKFTEAGLVSLKVDADQEYLRLQVADTGSGIPEREQSRIFEPFVQVDGSTTRRFSGTGLGLSISQQLVRMMAGRISLHSELGIGTTFTVSLPFSQPDSDSAQENNGTDQKIETNSIKTNTTPIEDHLN
jgi:signal transduction histidine kinase